MGQRENPVFGRKIFFLNPPLFVENKVINYLKSKEYEIYVIRDYRDAKPILSQYEDAICYVNIDDQLSTGEWFNFIKSFETQENVSSIFLGVLTNKISVTDRNKYLMDLKLPGGLLCLNEMGDKTAEKLEKILELNGAKGRRQYIRLNCRENEDVISLLAVNNKMYNFRLNDISSVGCACVISEDLIPIFQKNTVIQNFCLTLGRISIVCPSLVFDVKSIGGLWVAVLLFTKDTGRDTREEIRSYIFKVLEKRCAEIMDSSIKDMTDYSVKEDDLYTKPEDDPSFVPETVSESSASMISELDELEDLDEI